MSFIKILGCKAYVKRQAFDKLRTKFYKWLFNGYPKQTKGYYFYKLVENKVIVAHSGVFLECEFISRKNSRSQIEFEEVLTSQDSIEHKMEHEQSLHEDVA